MRTKVEAVAALQTKARREAENATRKMFVALCRQSCLPAPTPEYQFAKDQGRRWRFDWAWLSARIALEVEGGIWTGGRHVRGAGALRDMEKYNNATMRGWRLIHCTPDTLLTTATVEMIRRVMEIAA